MSGIIDKQFMQINDRNDLLNKRHTHSQLKSITVMPKEGLTLKQLAAQAALASGLQKEINAVRRENETLRRDAQHLDKVGLGDRAGRQLQALASTFVACAEPSLFHYYQTRCRRTTAASIAKYPSAECQKCHKLLAIYDIDSGIPLLLSNQ
jgi:hypothetical protein